MSVEKQLEFEPLFKQQHRQHLKWFSRIMAKTVLFWVIVMSAISYSSSDKLYNSQLILDTSSYSATHGENLSFKYLKMSDDSFTRAIQQGDSNSVLIALQQNPQLLNQTNEFGVSPLALAVISNKNAVAQVLLASGADPNEVSWNNMDLLHLPSIYAYDNTAMKKLLINSGANISANDYEYVKSTLSGQQSRPIRSIDNSPIVKNEINTPDLSWLAFWDNYFTRNNQSQVLKDIISTDYPDMKNMTDDIKTLDNLLKE